MSKAPDAVQLERLRDLAALPDDQIDTSDQPVIEDWSQGVRGGTPRDVRRKLAADAASGASQTVTSDQPALEAFIGRWQGREGGQERANYALYLSELCDVLGVARPDPASASTETNDYVFERAVLDPGLDGGFSHRRIDLYKRGCFVLEAKQSRQKGGKKEVPGQPDLFARPEPARRGARSASRAWDVLMLNARRQAEGYARALPVSHGWPPFILVCDVGHVLEVYADFSGQGKNYAQFPDRQSFRIYLEDLRQAEVRDRLERIWTDPLSLDPARKTARVTRAIAERLAAVSRALEAEHHPPEDVAMFLMRCLFTMFAEDVGLLPKASFRRLLERCEQDPDRLGPMVGQLWEAMDRGDFAIAIEARVKRFNGEFFKTRTVLPLAREEIGELRQAASYDWREVDPSIFGTLLEQALDAKERRRLGAHYTPRAYVERLVVATIIEPLRADWDRALSTAERQKSEGRLKDAVTTITAFHEALCRTRVLDPACGSGNFLYVSLELVKRLEGEVLEALTDLGGQEVLRGLEGHTVDPHQFLGLEINPRAAAIAELVLWIGYLQWHLRTQSGFPSEPILKAFRNIVVKDAVLEAKVTLVRDRNGKPVTRVGPDGAEVEVYRYDDPRQPEWPEAEFIVGNPPFIGSKFFRSRLG
ncbi:MAG TPA: type IIL restriction-modification enzyme MmeI, partial [Acetobacteraceae bacterium]